MIELEVQKASSEEVYEILTTLVVPRPIAWVSSISKEGVFNLAPFSFFNLVCDDPPILIISISNRDDGSLKDTVRNILNTKEFIVNIPSEDLIHELLMSSEDFPPHVNEFEITGLDWELGRMVKVPRVKRAKAWLECILFKHEELFDYHLIFGRVLFIGAFSLDYSELRPIGRVKGGFCKVFKE